MTPLGAIARAAAAAPIQSNLCHQTELEGAVGGDSRAYSLKLRRWSRNPLIANHRAKNGMGTRLPNVCPMGWQVPALFFVSVQNLGIFVPRKTARFRLFSGDKNGGRYRD